MAVTFTAAQALLAAQATALSTEATAAGLTSLAAALTNLATEITQIVSEQEFFGGTTNSSVTSGTPPVTTNTSTDSGSAALVWAQTLETAASIIKAKNSTAVKTSISAIETDINTVASNSTTIKDKQTIIADKQTVIADKTTSIETYQKKLKELGETTGIRSRGPFETWGNISTYKYLIEQAKILDETNKASPDLQERALQSIQDYLAVINEKGKEF
jgi:hypothetical protein